jgi:hypothetical protein
MKYLLIVAVVLFGMQPRTGAAQAQAVTQQSADAPSVRLDIPVAIDTTLPEGVAAVTVCDSSTGKSRPIVVAKYEPTPETLVHEGVHVLQIMRYGGCPTGWLHITNDKISLLNAEAEAYCVEAYWLHAHTGKEVRKSLVEAVRSLLELSTARAKFVGPEWQLTPGEIGEAFTQACPDNTEPRFVPGTSFTGRVSSDSQRVVSTLPEPNSSRGTQDSGPVRDNHLFR